MRRSSVGESVESETFEIGAEDHGETDQTRTDRLSDELVAAATSVPSPSFSSFPLHLSLAPS